MGFGVLTRGHVEATAIAFRKVSTPDRFGLTPLPRYAELFAESAVVLEEILGVASAEARDDPVEDPLIEAWSDDLDQRIAQVVSARR